MQMTKDTKNTHLFLTDSYSTTCLKKKKGTGENRGLKDMLIKAQLND